jgi:cholesterol transport system auxiliary component
MIKILIFAAMLLAGCTATGTKVPVAVYDLGLPPPQSSSALSADTPDAPASAAGLLVGSVLVAEAASPLWLDNQGIHYRLGYHDTTRLYAYANSRWAAAPATFISRRIKGLIASRSGTGVIGSQDGVPADYVLRIDLEEFSQVFDAPDRSRVIVRLRTSLIDRRTRSMLFQQPFEGEQAASTADAPGAVHALAAVSDRLTGQVVDWVARKLVDEKTRKKTDQ